MFHFLPNLPLSSKSSAEEMEEMSFFHFLPSVRKKLNPAFKSVICIVYGQKDHLSNVLRVKHLSLRVKQLTLRVKPLTLRVKTSVLLVRHWIHDPIGHKLQTMLIIVTSFYFKKAFDTVNHRILISKLRKYGIRGHILQWFESYLKNRKQFVQIKSFKSQIKSSTCGVPQGSILGPLLFIL